MLKISIVTRHANTKYLCAVKASIFHRVSLGSVDSQPMCVADMIFGFLIEDLKCFIGIVGIVLLSYLSPSIFFQCFC